jgi:hypothetical protein
MPLQLYKIASNDLTASAATVTFSSIPQGYTDLKVVISARATSSLSGIFISFNGSSSSFTGRYLEGNGATVGSGSLTQYVGTEAGGSSTANTFSNVEIYIPNYTSANNKSFSADAVGENNATTAYATFNAGLWSSSAAITSVGFVLGAGNIFAANSTFSLYGIL